MAERWAVGCMTGTSCDGIDAALVRLEGEGLSLRAEVVRHVGQPLEALGDTLRKIAAGEKVSAEIFAEVGWWLGLAHAAIVEQVAEGQKLDLIAVHGQTLFHAPPLSLQWINPHPIAQKIAAPVVYDLRGADLACAGQGAPITPLADFLMFASDDERRAVVNLGGFVNITALPKRADGVEAVEGRDVCACNQVLDAVARARWSEPFDVDGKRAAAGTADATATADLWSRLRDQSRAGRSLGTGDEVTAWVEKFAESLDPDDQAASACAAIGRRVAESVRGADRVILAGGGVRNAALRDRIAQASGARVELSDDHGVSIEAREAAAMAILGALSADRVPITLPAVTGCAKPAPVSGCWVMP